METGLCFPIYAIEYPRNLSCGDELMETSTTIANISQEIDSQSLLWR